MKVREFNEHIEEVKFVDDSIVDLPAVEAVSTVMDVNGEPMKVFICTDKIIEDNKLKPVTNPVSFSSMGGRIPTNDGIFSETIFGISQSSKNLNHAYIDLKHKFFHPYVFEMLKDLHRKVEDVCTGEKVWMIENGKFVEVTDETSKNYDPANTGLDFIINNFDKLKFEKNGSRKHDEEVEFFNTLTKNEIFITKWIVIPRAYRDFSANGKMTSVDPINNQYTKLISHANSIESGISGYIAHKTLYQMQELLVSIRAYGQQLIEKKHGLIHKAVFGRSSSFGSRGVISVPSLVGCNTPDDCQVDMIHTGLPLSKCVESGYPFVIRWLNEWVENNLKGGEKVFYIPSKEKPSEMVPTEARIKDHTSIFDTKYLKKRLEMFRMGYGGRWEPIQIELEDGSKQYMAFTGRGNALDPNRPETATIVNRPLTWCDLIYMACEETLSDKHVYCTRYPVEDYFNVVPSRVSVLSTIKTMPMFVNGKMYKHYPVINPFADEITVSRSFIDTISLSNLHLEGLGGDYDGDTVSLKVVFSIEANEEAEQKLMNLTNYMTLAGSIIRVLGNESTLCMYNMTRRRSA